MKILVALDGSDRAEAAVGAAAELTRAGGGQLILLNVFSPFVDTGRVTGATQEDRRAELIAQRAAYVEGVARTLGDVPAEAIIEPRQKTEDVDECIARVAAERGADMVVVTSKQASGLAGLVLGSTAQGLLRMSPCPVLIVRPRDHEEENATLGTVSAAVRV
jgi:nucleotide-binding universal stress UspA family protein